MSNKKKEVHMKTKGQAAMEFLMTYGWAILAAIIVIGVLAVYFRPSSLTSQSFVVTAPFYGVGATLNGNSDVINMEIKNNGGETLNVTNVSVALTQPSALTCSNSTLSAGQQTGTNYVYTIPGCTPLASGQSASGTVTIYYSRAGSTLQLTSTGSISGTAA